MQLSVIIIDTLSERDVLKIMRIKYGVLELERGHMDRAAIAAKQLAAALALTMSIDDWILHPLHEMLISVYIFKSKRTVGFIPYIRSQDNAESLDRVVNESLLSARFTSNAKLLLQGSIPGCVIVLRATAIKETGFDMTPLSSHNLLDVDAVREAIFQMTGISTQKCQELFEDLRNPEIESMNVLDSLYEYRKRNYEFNHEDGDKPKE